MWQVTIRSPFFSDSLAVTVLQCQSESESVLGAGVFHHGISPPTCEREANERVDGLGFVSGILPDTTLLVHFLARTQ